MKFINKTSNIRLDVICNTATDLVTNPKFISLMNSIHGFNPKYTSPEVSGSWLVSRLKDLELTLEIYEYKTLVPWSKAYGYTTKSGPQVYLNSRRFDRSDASIVATLLHEAVHQAENRDLKLRYNHGDNTYKGGTAPEVVADYAYLALTGIYSTLNSAIVHQ